MCQWKKNLNGRGVYHTSTKAFLWQAIRKKRAHKIFPYGDVENVGNLRKCWEGGQNVFFQMLGSNFVCFFNFFQRKYEKGVFSTEIRKKCIFLNLRDGESKTRTNASPIPNPVGTRFLPKTCGASNMFKIGFEKRSLKMGRWINCWLFASQWKKGVCREN